jgi:hypothetical protein
MLNVQHANGSLEPLCTSFSNRPPGLPACLKSLVNHVDGSEQSTGKRVRARHDSLQFRWEI